MGGLWGGLGAEEALAVAVWALMALPAPPEHFLVQPGLVHLLPAAQHHPGCQTCQVLPPHGHRRCVQVRSCPSPVTALGLGSTLRTANCPFMCPVAACGADPKVMWAGAGGREVAWDLEPLRMKTFWRRACLCLPCNSSLGS